MLKKILFIFYVTCFDGIAQPTFNKEAVNLAKKAGEILVDPDVPVSEVKKALNYVEKAIKLDSTYYRAYITKASILIKLHEREKAILSLKEAVKIKPTFAELMEMQGCLYEKMGKIDMAKSKYREAIAAYNNRPVSKLSEIINSKINIIFLNMLIDNNKNLAIKKLDQMLKIYPNEQVILDNKKSIESFDRKEFMNGF